MLCTSGPQQQQLHRRHPLLPPPPLPPPPEKSICCTKWQFSVHNSITLGHRYPLLLPSPLPPPVGPLVRLPNPPCSTSSQTLVHLPLMSSTVFNPFALVVHSVHSSHVP